MKYDHYNEPLPLLPRHVNLYCLPHNILEFLIDRYSDLKRDLMRLGRGDGSLIKLLKSHYGAAAKSY